MRAKLHAQAQMLMVWNVTEMADAQKMAHARKYTRVCEYVFMYVSIYLCV